MSEMNSLIESMSKLAKVEAAQEFEVQVAAWKTRLLEAERRATRAEDRANLSDAVAAEAVAALAVLQDALRGLLA